MVWVNGYYIWYNDMRNAWIVQDGVEIVKQYKHLGHAKNYASNH